VSPTRRFRHEVAWDPDGGQIDAAKLEGVDVVVHLAGRASRRPMERGAEGAHPAESREGTGLLAGALARLSPAAARPVSGSAMGVYGDRATRC
jgi:NAD dependent epimerase/dehydratase family enzyme